MRDVADAQSGETAFAQHARTPFLEPFALQTFQAPRFLFLPTLRNRVLRSRNNVCVRGIGDMLFDGRGTNAKLGGDWRFRRRAPSVDATASSASFTRYPCYHHIRTAMATFRSGLRHQAFERQDVRLRRSGGGDDVVHCETHRQTDSRGHARGRAWTYQTSSAVVLCLLAAWRAGQSP